MIMSIISSDYLPYQVAAEKLQLSPESVRRYIHQGKISAEFAGRTYYIHKDEVKRFRSERKPVGRPAKKTSK